MIPGDIVEITQNLEIPADMILLEGTCVINETMLTGESTPVIKTSINKKAKTKIGKYNTFTNIKVIFKVLYHLSITYTQDQYVFIRKQ